MCIYIYIYIYIVVVLTRIVIYCVVPEAHEGLQWTIVSHIHSHYTIYYNYLVYTIYYILYAIYYINIIVSTISNAKKTRGRQILVQYHFRHEYYFKCNNTSSNTIHTCVKGIVCFYQ